MNIRKNLAYERELSLDEAARAIELARAQGLKWKPDIFDLQIARGDMMYLYKEIKRYLTNWYAKSIGITKENLEILEIAPEVLHPEVYGFPFHPVFSVKNSEKRAFLGRGRLSLNNLSGMDMLTKTDIGAIEQKNGLIAILDNPTDITAPFDLVELGKHEKKEKKYVVCVNDISKKIERFADFLKTRLLGTQEKVIQELKDLRR